MDQSPNSFTLLVPDAVIAMDADPPAVRLGAAVRIRNGRIETLGPADQLDRPGQAVRRLPGCVLTPGLINAHAHLDISYWTAAGRTALAGRPLHDWVAPVVAERVVRSGDETADAAARAAAESLAAGVTCIVDVASMLDWKRVQRALAGSAVRVIPLAEVIGFGPRGRESFEQASQLLAGPEVGLSPHAPYSADEAVYRDCLAAAAGAGRVLMTHLSETPEEIEFCRTGGGPWRVRLEQLAGPLPNLAAPGVSPVAYAHRLGLLDYPHTLLAHVNYLEPGDLDLLRTGRASIVFCPRSASYFGHADHPWRRLAEAGVNVAIGTDSLASSPSVSVLEELHFLRQRGGGDSAGRLFATATRNAARAIGRAGQLGVIAPGAAADLAAWPVSVGPRGGDPAHQAERLLAEVIQTKAPPAAVFVGGRKIPPSPLAGAGGGAADANAGDPSDVATP